MEIISQETFIIKIKYGFNVYKKHGYQNVKIIERIDKLHRSPFSEFGNGFFYLVELSQWTRRVPVWEGKKPSWLKEGLIVEIKWMGVISYIDQACKRLENIMELLKKDFSIVEKIEIILGTESKYYER